MSHQNIENIAINAPIRRKTIPQLQAHKNATPCVMLTAYTAQMAQRLDAHCDVLLVGDSLGMVVYGFDSTLPVTLDMMIAHGAAVMRGSKQALVIVDMPFGSYQKSAEQAFESAARIMAETGAQGVKLEGGVEMAESISYLTKRGIPVIGHVGLTPQSVNVLGGYKAQGKTDKAAQIILADAIAVANAGAAGIVIEGVIETLGEAISKAVDIPTIGIGASVACDGQVLVSEDMLGITPKTAKFVGRFAEMGDDIEAAAKAYAQKVRTRQFPEDKHCYHAPKIAQKAKRV
jgi:3-methyl-2-oxobutanoate hydroxymethyltransferase